MLFVCIPNFVGCALSLKNKNNKWRNRSEKKLQQHQRRATLYEWRSHLLRWIIWWLSESCSDKLSQQCQQRVHTESDCVNWLLARQLNYCCSNTWQTANRKYGTNNGRTQCWPNVVIENVTKIHFGRCHGNETSSTPISNYKNVRAPAESQAQREHFATQKFWTSSSDYVFRRCLRR